MKTVREFSMAGPCLMLGEFVRETPEFFFYRDRFASLDPHGTYRHKVSRIKKRGLLVHVEPCASCRDHPKTHYPNGYDN